MKEKAEFFLIILISLIIIDWSFKYFFYYVTGLRPSLSFSATRATALQIHGKIYYFKYSGRIRLSSELIVLSFTKSVRH